MSKRPRRFFRWPGLTRWEHFFGQLTALLVALYSYPSKMSPVGRVADRWVLKNTLFKVSKLFRRWTEVRGSYSGWPCDFNRPGQA